MPLGLFRAGRHAEQSADHAGVLPLSVLLGGVGATLSGGGFFAPVAGGALLAVSLGTRLVPAGTSRSQ